ncbi:related to Mitochondrial acidic protein MAM33 [Saccharomycodes ludwigii]|uniref:Related to Mitochondrial acidic protein MAM33 n=1 Tax=Saccharomycodes ludwigii TaxID=36035 RepID=A0A376B5W1_9ASCO|nr:hypothetical protein SCDLUD_000321 [Saccharomycodes ludwigii]KAH3902735.1 hypothetical protein SCDLUD_000321 [Saccharomycodes ludwigii]SSD60096.1 related to Mitochondrial acidic protein MAM33 [Saccharomycodes ludwigii]
MSLRLTAARASKLSTVLRTINLNSSRIAVATKHAIPCITTASISARPFSSLNHAVLNAQTEKVSQVLSSEIDLELSENVDSNLPEELSTFLTKSGFSIVPTPGKSLSEIVKESADETVHAFFDVAQIANLPYENAGLDPHSGENQQQETSDLDNAENDSFNENFANVNVVVVKKSDDTAVSFELLMNLHEGSFYVDSVTPYKSAKAALDESAQAEVSRELVYHGPPFSNLDEELQESLEVYLESRGVDENLTTFISAYSEYNEEKEYVNWLKTLKKFFN